MAMEVPGTSRSEPHLQRLKIGISACFLHPDPQRNAFASKTLQYIEQSMAHWVMSGGALPVLVPAPPGEAVRPEPGAGGPNGTADVPAAPASAGARAVGTSLPQVALADYAGWLDGLIVHGGADVWPGSYGEQPLQPQWSGDRLRDAYEIALVRAFCAAGKPVFGVCRGFQLLNVHFGGTLFQDIVTQHPEAREHREIGRYERHLHSIELVPGTRLAELYPGVTRATANSIHHQGLKDIAPGFTVEARCPDDGIVEAFRRHGPSYVAGVQWHPEFHDPEDTVTFDDGPMLQDFFAAARSAKA